MRKLIIYVSPLDEVLFYKPNTGWVKKDIWRYSDFLVSDGEYDVFLPQFVCVGICLIEYVSDQQVERQINKIKLKNKINKL